MGKKVVRVEHAEESWRTEKLTFPNRGDEIDCDHKNKIQNENEKNPFRFDFEKF